ncbi:hypothetical protein IGI04_037622 [Brassica rapa subsp. trilocularis]|uniref:Uncharacterized protein n=1 Tax=Brassica rapa subsp. trilocularis TaxID=1813537 RepID=A0ABQ7LHZ3_BRACM|nr:hypothetical protein IGI04_037622 [Brassica rapa subsp. trilocularis]
MDMDLHLDVSNQTREEREEQWTLKVFHTRPKPLDFTTHSPIFLYDQYNLTTGCLRCFRGCRAVPTDDV